LQQHTKTYPGLSFFLLKDTLAVPVPDTTGIDSVTLAWIDPGFTASQPQAPPEPAFTFSHSGYDILLPFFRELADTNQQVRIAYYGDSSIEGDLISQTFREAMQQRFGGEGVGFLAMVVSAPGFRRSVNHRFSEDWAYGPVGSPNPWDMPYSMDAHWYSPAGEKALPADSSAQESNRFRPWVRFFRSKHYQTTTRFPRLRFFYGAAASDSLTANRLQVRLFGETQSYTLSGKGRVNELVLSRSPCLQVELQFDLSSRLPIYGLSAESGQGVVVDNFALRSNTGIPLLRLPKAQLRAFQEKLDYDLVILQFGLNMIDPGRRDFAGYRQQFGRVIRHFQEALPGVPVLVVGVSDKGTRVGGQMVTDPSVPYLTRAQQRATEDRGATFFSFYQAMGGSGSMVRWVEEESPRLANTDYTHFNFRGGRIASNMLVDFLLKGYRAYRDQKDASELLTQTQDTHEDR
jgi:lysophospholipase L1-like esterase